MGGGVRAPLETIFKQLDFKPLVFGAFAEMSSNVKYFVEMAVEYGIGHLGVDMAAMTRMWMVRWLSNAHTRHNCPLQRAWRGYANLILERTRYVDTSVASTNRAHIGQEMIDRANAGKHIRI